MVKSMKTFICTTEFSTFWKTSGSDDDEVEEVDSDDGGLELFDGCDCAANAAVPSDDEGDCCNKWTNSIHSFSCHLLRYFIKILLNYDAM